MHDYEDELLRLKARVASLEQMGDKIVLRRRSRKFEDRHAPREPDRVRAIVYRRDFQWMTFEEIAEADSGSTVAVWKLYYRWHEWAIAQGLG